MEKSKFPAEQVQENLITALVEVVKNEALMKGIELPETDEEISGMDFVIDSLLVVALLSQLETQLDIELKQDVVRSGGYDSVSDALEHLASGIEEIWNKKEGEMNEPVSQ